MPTHAAPPEIRFATEADLPALLAIYNEAILTTTAVFSDAPQSLAERREWYREKQQSNWPVLVAVQAARVVGYCTCGPFRAWPGYIHTAELSLYVAGPARGQGVGKHLLRQLLQQAQARQLHVLIAGIEATNEASLCLHRSFDFREVAHFEQVGYKFDRWLDLKFLQLLLPPSGVAAEINRLERHAEAPVIYK